MAPIPRRSRDLRRSREKHRRKRLCDAAPPLPPCSGTDSHGSTGVNCPTVERRWSLQAPWWPSASPRFARSPGEHPTTTPGSPGARPDYRDRHLELAVQRSVLRCGYRVLFVDDLAASGGQAHACQGLVNQAGAKWIGAAVIVDGLESAATRRELNLGSVLRLRELERLPKALQTHARLAALRRRSPRVSWGPACTVFTPRWRRHGRYQIAQG